MLLQKCCLAVFSPTGMTEKVAQAVSVGLGLPVRTVDLCKAPAEQTLADDEVLLAAVPVYGGRVPAVAKQRLAALHGEGGAAVAVAVYGNRAYDDALLELCDALTAAGFTVPAAGAFVAEHCMARNIAAGRPDTNDLQMAEGFGRRAVQKIADGKLGTVTVPGDPTYREKTLGGGIAPKTSAACIGCGSCAAACPVGAIPLENPRQTGPNCIGCMRCVALCKQGARSLPAAKKLAVAGMLKVACAKPRQPELFL